MWGGRFAEGPAAVMREINASIPFDKRLWAQDIRASKAHVAMLAARAIVSSDDAKAISDGLDQIAQEYEANGVPVDLALEDIHMATEARLAELIGPTAGRLHTARSRNDQVATDFRIWVRDAMDAVEAGLIGLQRALLTRAEENADAVMPGFTHLQSAQPVTLGHHLMAWFEMIRRDRGRFVDARARMNECPLGAAALAGTGFPIDRHATAKALGFDKPTDNSLDSVSDRDFAIDYLMAASQCALHLSRMSEEIVIWASQPFGFVALLGVIALMGMIQRNSVILIDQIEQDRANGVPAWDAIVESAVRRLRPIVLTAAAAVLAMIPLSRSVFWGPMAVAKRAVGLKSPLPAEAKAALPTLLSIA